MLHLAAFRKTCQQTTAEKTQQHAPGYQRRMEEFLYLPAEESADLSGGESLSAGTDKSLVTHRRTAATPVIEIE